ncbi:MAG: cation:proton antiporter [Acidobacteria bacterium]|nr:MAG: cation:proton antiporter [Acidobacteriota bacterium]
MRRIFLALALLAILLAVGSGGVATEATEDGHGGHAGAITLVLLGMVIMLVAAKVGGELAQRVDQPAVLGELLAGVVLGNLALMGYHGLDFLATDPGIAILAEIGVVLLLFEVGLESNVPEMLSVGPSSLLVAVLGVVAPFFLGWGVSAWMLPEEEHSRPSLYRRHPVCHQRRDHRPRAHRPGQGRLPRGAGHSGCGGHRRCSGSCHPRRHLRHHHRGQHRRRAAASSPPWTCCGSSARRRCFWWAPSSSAVGSPPGSFGWPAVCRSAASC